MQILNRNQVEEQTAQNLLEAGVIRTEEVAKTIKLLKDYSLSALLATLAESQRLREQAGNPSRPVVFSLFSLN